MTGNFADLGIEALWSRVASFGLSSAYNEAWLCYMAGPAARTSAAWSSSCVAGFESISEA